MAEKEEKTIEEKVQDTMDRFARLDQLFREVMFAPLQLFGAQLPNVRTRYCRGEGQGKGFRSLPHLNPIWNESGTSRFVSTPLSDKTRLSLEIVQTFCYLCKAQETEALRRQLSV